VLQNAYENHVVAASPITALYNDVFYQFQLINCSAKFKTKPNAIDLLWSCEGLWRGLSFVFSRSDCYLTI